MTDILPIIIGILIPIYYASLLFICIISNYNNPFKKWIHINIPLYISNRNDSVTNDMPKTYFAWDLISAHSLVSVI